MSEARTRAAVVFGHLVRVVHEISQGGARELRRHGLTPAQYQLLNAVDARPGATQQQLCDNLGVTKGNVSMLIDRLETAGLATRIPSGAAYDIRVTHAGAELLAVLRPEHTRYLDERFAGLTNDDLDHVMRILGKLEAPT